MCLQQNTFLWTRHTFVLVRLFTDLEHSVLMTEIEDLVQSAEHGVIVVSFGSNVEHLPDDIIMKLVNVFRKRKELFLMR